MLKQKPISKMKNVARVELFDDLTGQKKEEWLSENIINSGLDMYAYKSVVIQALLGIPVDLGHKDIINSNSNISTFGNLVLTDYTGVEDATLKRMQGTIKGWANKYATYVGSDILRGTINQAESLFTPKTALKFVFDWPTSAANGTFRTLWWLPSETYSTTTSPFNNSCSSFVSNMSLGTSMVGTTNPFCVVNNKLFYISGTSVYSTLRDISSVGRMFKTTSTLEKNITADDTTPKGVQFDGTYFWVFGSQNAKMYKYDTSFTLVTSWICTTATYIPTYQFTCLGGKIYTYRYVDATTWNIYKFSDTGTLEATYNVYSASYAYFSGASAAVLTNDGTNLFLFNAYDGSIYRFLEIDQTGNFVYDGGMDCYNIQSYVNRYVHIDEYKNLLVSSSTSSLYYFFPMIRPTAQTLLASAVTKTSANTLKVTYTFTLDTSSLTT
jgi:hypothetical protein